MNALQFSGMHLHITPFHHVALSFESKKVYTCSYCSLEI